jgi:hypothetical protein
VLFVASTVPTTSYMAGAMGTYNWGAADTVGTSKWWILAALIVDCTIAVRPRQLDAADAMGISSWRVADAMGAVGAALATSALASSGMSTILVNFMQL